MNTQFRHHKLSEDDESRLVYVKPEIGRASCRERV